MRLWQRRGRADDGGAGGDQSVERHGTKMIGRFGLLAAGWLLGAAGPLSISGSVAHPQVYDASALEKLPATHVVVTTEGEHGGPKQAAYDGVLLWLLLDKAGLVDAPGKKTKPLHVFLARGADGYAVALSIGEIAPMYEAKQVIVAYAQDGKALDGLKLVVPGDKRAARFVHDLANIDVK